MHTSWSVDSKLFSFYVFCFDELKQISGFVGFSIAEQILCFKQETRRIKCDLTNDNCNKIKKSKTHYRKNKTKTNPKHT